MPVAYFIAKRLTGPWRFIMLFLVVLPFFTSFVARTYAWYFILGGRGLPALLDWMGFGRFRLLNSEPAVFAGVVYAYLPIMILTLFIAFDRVGNDLIEASYDLGRGRIETVFSVVLPLALPGIISGYTLVFMLLSGNISSRCCSAAARSTSSATPSSTCSCNHATGRSDRRSPSRWC